MSYHHIYIYIDWFIDCWLLHINLPHFSCIFKREHVEQFINKYTQKWVKDHRTTTAMTFDWHWKHIEGWIYLGIPCLCVAQKSIQIWATFWNSLFFEWAGGLGIHVDISHVYVACWVRGYMLMFPICEEPLCWWSYVSWIYNYLCNQCLLPLTLWVQILFMARLTLCNDMW
jgi:hypothetical protein